MLYILKAQKEVTAFVADKHFQPSLIFMAKVEVHPL
jgi:hypothetical protein